MSAWTVDVILHAAAMLLGLFLLMHGVAFFVVGLLPGRSGSTFAQYGWAAITLTGAYYLLAFTLTG